tara:strand:- start:1600 stop:1959 length:360 start_codon:yes stop_codon:yes gene_type:complete
MDYDGHLCDLEIPQEQYDTFVSKIENSKGKYSWLYFKNKKDGTKLIKPIRRKIKFSEDKSCLWVNHIDRNEWCMVIPQSKSLPLSLRKDIWNRVNAPFYSQNSNGELGVWRRGQLYIIN